MLTGIMADGREIPDVGVRYLSRDCEWPAQLFVLRPQLFVLRPQLFVLRPQLFVLAVKPSRSNSLNRCIVFGSWKPPLRPTEVVSCCHSSCCSGEAAGNIDRDFVESCSFTFVV